MALIQLYKACKAKPFTAKHAKMENLTIINSKLGKGKCVRNVSFSLTRKANLSRKHFIKSSFRVYMTEK